MTLVSKKNRKPLTLLTEMSLLQSLAFTSSSSSKAVKLKRSTFSKMSFMVIPGHTLSLAPPAATSNLTSGGESSILTSKSIEVVSTDKVLFDARPAQYLAALTGRMFCTFNLAYTVSHFFVAAFKKQHFEKLKRDTLNLLRKAQSPISSNIFCVNDFAALVTDSLDKLDSLGTTYIIGVETVRHVKIELQGIKFDIQPPSMIFHIKWLGSKVCKNINYTRWLTL